MWLSERAWRRAFGKAQAGGVDQAEMQRLSDSRMTEDQMLWEEYHALYTRQLEREAFRLRVPVPPRPWGTESQEDENWSRGHYLGEWILKTEGIKKVRTEIRAERRARAEQLVQWATLLIGLVGAATGLMAVILR
jgi:hypothetical protein